LLMKKYELKYSRRDNGERENVILSSVWRIYQKVKRVDTIFDAPSSLKGL